MKFQKMRENLNFLNTPKKDYGDLISYFDSYNLDKNTPSRIINFLKNEIN